MVASRIFAVLAAALLVSAFALAALAPDDLDLAQGLALMDHDWLVWLPQHTPDWMWEWVEKPLLIRPVWLLPAAFGIVCGGAALTLSSRPPSRSHRRRS